MSNVRTREPVRTQVRWQFEAGEDTLRTDHPARLLWRVVEQLDLFAFLKDRRAVVGNQGRDVLSAKMLLTLWLYAISVNVGSAREIERRTQTDDAFKWIVGDQRVGRSTLSAFRVGHAEALDKLMTDVLALLLHKGLLDLDLVAQDGTRVRASASAPSFRRSDSLEECREQAALHLKVVLAETDGDPRLRALREAKARDYEQRVGQAIAEVQQSLDRAGASKSAAAEANAKSPRASTTDPQAKVMKMADGGFRPAYNVQLATAGDPMGGPRTIVGVRVTNVGSDMGSVAPMLDQIERRTGALPDALLADANHADVASITAAHERGVRPIISVPKRSATSGPRADKSPAVVAWREDMATNEAKQLLRARASLCELPNAHAKTRFAMASLLVRGLKNVTSVALLVALTHNLMGHAAALLG
jgi:transposase